MCLLCIESEHQRSQFIFSPVAGVRRLVRWEVVFANIWCILGNLAFCVYLWSYRSYLSELLDYSLFRFILCYSTFSFVTAIAILFLQSLTDDTAQQNDARGAADYAFFEWNDFSGDPVIVDVRHYF